MSKETGGPAFPITKSRDENYCDEAGYARTRTVSGLTGGMTLLDYFAAKAMQSIVVCDETDFDTYELRAQFAYRQAAAMLKAREQQS